MIRTLQKKFVLTAMTAVSVLLLVVLGALNISNAVSNSQQTERILDELSAQLGAGMFDGSFPPEPMSGQDFAPMGSPPGDSMGNPPEGPMGNPAPGSEPQPDTAQMSSGMRPFRSFLQEPMGENLRLSSLYFTVLLDGQGQIVSTDVSHIASVSEEDAGELALGLDLDSGKGSVSSYHYKIYNTPEGNSRIVFLDTEARRVSVLRVLLLSALMGLISWLLMLVLVRALSRRAILPIAQNMERQRQFVTDAGHELKTPLAIILANVDAMELRGGESKYSRNIRTQALRLSDLMKNLLTLARMDEHSVLDRASVLDFSSLCGESFEMFREPAALRKISFRTDLASGLSVRGDRSMLDQLCSILGDNAVKYCPEGGEIAVSLRPDSRGCCLCVKNSVTEAPDAARLFDRFYRSDSSRNQKSGGFGIGLSAAQSIVRLHNAEISAELTDDNSALMFLVHFPTV
ncbi:MAG: HAMP domain-containing histidine kinase [Oscillospiraceae bacterium]|nr:HAMP domain-containing histidine kinase [Oscillospiraceae bacterium]